MSSSANAEAVVEENSHETGCSEFETFNSPSMVTEFVVEHRTNQEVEIDDEEDEEEEAENGVETVAEPTGAGDQENK